MNIGFFLPLLVLPVSAGPLCSTQEYWDSNTQECRTTCSVCPAGWVRDFKTKVVTNGDGQDEDRKCPPCRPCDEGQYSTKITNKCTNCSKSCKRENRQMQLPCKGLHDMICGSCLPGYEDVYDSLDFPCIKTTENPSVEDPISDTPTELKVKNNETDHDSETTSSGNETWGIVGTVASVLFGITIAVCVVLFVIQRWTTVQCPRRTHAVTFGSYKSLSKDVIETDGANEAGVMPRADETDVKTTDKTVTGTAVRGELSYGLYTTAKHCGHAIPSICTCSADTFPDSIIHKSDPCLRTVAMEACHDPRTLYHELHVPHNTVYQLDDDRDRHPELIAQSETILKILNGWVESSQEKPRLSALLKALCRSGFHHITEMLLKETYNTNNNS